MDCENSNLPYITFRYESKNGFFRTSERRVGRKSRMINTLKALSFSVWVKYMWTTHKPRYVCTRVWEVEKKVRYSLRTLRAVHAEKAAVLHSCILSLIFYSCPLPELAVCWGVKHADNLAVSWRLDPIPRPPAARQTPAATRPTNIASRLNGKHGLNPAMMLGHEWAGWPHLTPIFTSTHIV